MSIKEMFLVYVELQRNANATRDAHGIESEVTKIAYDKANKQKQKVLDEIEDLEYRMKSLEK